VALLVAGCGAGAEEPDGGSGGTNGAGACSGYWQAPEPVLSLGAGQSLRGGPAVALGGLELFYIVLQDATSSFVFDHVARGSVSEPFGAPMPLPELAAICAGGEPHGIDVSEDALRAYVSCHDNASTRSVRVARRPTLTEPFVNEGQVASQSAPPTLSGAAHVGLDERALYVSATSADGPPMVATRDAVGETFGSFETIAGLQDVSLLYPAPGPDELSLFGSTKVGDVPTLAYVTRPSVASPFGSLVYLFAGAGYASVPEVGADCRTLYIGTTATVFALRR
jgi:hypothetical protein